MTRLSDHRLVKVCCVLVLAGIAGCTTSASKLAASDSTVRPEIIFTQNDTALLERITFDTLATHVSPRDNIVPGPSTRIVLDDPQFFAEAWHSIGAQNNPPNVDFKKNTVVLIGTDTYGSGNMNVAVDSVFRVGRKLYAIVQEYSNGAMIDVSSRGSVALVIPGRFDPASVTFIGRPTVDRFSH